MWVSPIHSPRACKFSAVKRFDSPGSFHTRSGTRCPACIGSPQRPAVSYRSRKIYCAQSSACRCEAIHRPGWCNRYIGTRVAVALMPVCRLRVPCAPDKCKRHSARIAADKASALPVSPPQRPPEALHCARRVSVIVAIEYLPVYFIGCSCSHNLPHQFCPGVIARLCEYSQIGYIVNKYSTSYHGA